MRVNQPNNNPVQQSEVAKTKKTTQGKEAEAAKRAQKTGQTSSTQASGQATGGAQAEISARGKEFAKAKEVATNAPDVREEKIAALEKKIAEGKYKVDAGAVADKMVDDHIKMQGMS